MSRQIYWGVMKKGAWGKTVAWPRRFHFRYSDAKSECQRHNENEKSFQKPKHFFVTRFLLDFKDKVHYDVYKHEVKRI